jgi:uncharacterized membrane protein YhaH (DUF805 family)
MSKKGNLIRVSDLWRWDGTISRATYATWGSGLVAVKYAIDTFVAGVIFHRPWSWLNYISPGQAIDVLAISKADQVFFLTMILISIPFIWVGIVLTMRRLRAAGLPVWLCKLFFVPIVNLLVFASLCLLPTQSDRNILDRDEDPDLLEADDATDDKISGAKKLPGSVLPPLPPLPSQPAIPSQPPVPPQSQSMPAHSGIEYPPLGELVSGKLDKNLPFSKENRWSDGAYAVVMTVPAAAVLAFLSTSVFPSYGWSLFIGLPFAIGMASSYFYGRNQLRSPGDSILIASIAITLLGLTVFLWAWEGMICLLMAAPIGYVLAILGAILGYNLQKKKNLPVHARRIILSMFIILPLTMAAEYAERPQFPTIAVCTTCYISAPPERVWENIIAFPQLPAPKEWIFQTGIAYPIGATISGAGVGAVRHCKFTTGNFIEPITAWNKRQLLAFNVKAQPEPMKEFSWIRDLQPAHLNGYLNVHRGEFRLFEERDAGGKVSTRVVGTTWYDNHMWPGSYWRFYADNIMHSIHNRVLMHIKNISENGSHSAPQEPAS